MAGLADRGQNLSLIGCGRFGQAPRARKQRPHSSRGQWLTLPEHNQSVAIPDVDLIALLETGLFAKSLRDDELTFTGDGRLHFLGNIMLTRERIKIPPPLAGTWPLLHLSPGGTMEISRRQGGMAAAATGRVVIIVPPRRERWSILDLPAPLAGVPHLFGFTHPAAAPADAGLPPAHFQQLSRLTRPKRFRYRASLLH